MQTNITESTEERNDTLRTAFKAVQDLVKYNPTEDFVEERDRLFDIEAVAPKADWVFGNKASVESYLSEQFDFVFSFLKVKLLPFITYEERPLSDEDCLRLKNNIPSFVVQYATGLEGGHINVDYTRSFLLSMFRIIYVGDVGLMTYNYTTGCYSSNSGNLSGFLFKLVLSTSYGKEVWSERLWSRLESGLINYVLNVPTEILDQRYVPVRNMDIDTVTGEVVDHSPDHYATIANSLIYDQSAKAPRWEGFLEEVIVDTEGKTDFETITALQMLVGNTISASHKANVFVYLHGGGANGKSVFLGAISKLIGPANTSAVGLSTLGGQFGKEPLLGKRVNIATENAVARDFNSSDLKSITSGDSIIVNRKNKLAITMILPTKMWFASNELIDFGDQTEGFCRRLKAIPFNRKFNLEDQDPNLVEELDLELPGILNWGLEGLNHLKTANYKIESSSNMIQLERLLTNTKTTEEDFVELYIKGDRSARVPRMDVYSAYQQYALSIQQIPSGMKLFWSTFESLIFKKFGIRIITRKSNGVRFAYGISLIK